MPATVWQATRPERGRFPLADQCQPGRPVARANLVGHVIARNTGRGSRIGARPGQVKIETTGGGEDNSGQKKSASKQGTLFLC